MSNNSTIFFEGQGTLFGVENSVAQGLCKICANFVQDLCIKIHTPKKDISKVTKKALSL